MARYKDRSRAQGLMMPIHLEDQIVPGTFEHTIDYLVDNEIDLSVFEQRYNNDETGAPAYDPAVLLKVILLGYARGMTSSRRIARACEENIIFIALSADSKPHFTTIAEFVSTMSDQIESGQGEGRCSVEVDMYGAQHRQDCSEAEAGVGRWFADRDRCVALRDRQRKGRRAPTRRSCAIYSQMVFLRLQRQPSVVPYPA